MFSDFMLNSGYYRQGYLAGLNQTGFKPTYNPFYVVSYMDGYSAGESMRQLITRRRWED